MHAAVLEAFGAPVAGEFRDPRPMPGATVLTVSAAAVNHVDLLKASGRFYTGPPPLPSVVGSDGVGRHEDGGLVYFDAPLAPFGSMADRTLVDSESLIPVPDGVDPVTGAALGNAGLAAHTGLQWRAGLQPAETVSSWELRGWWAVSLFRSLACWVPVASSPSGGTPKGCRG